MTARSVLVTGGSGAIGQAIARAFAAEGAALYLVDQKSADTDGIAAAGAVSAHASRCDVSDESGVAAAAADCVARHGGIDVIVNVAGAMIYRPIGELTAADWRRLTDVNLIGAALFIGEGFRRMKPGSVIINISSIHARRTSSLVAPYAAAKAALVSLTRSAAIEGRPLGIRVNAILPGAIDTPMLRDSPNIRSGREVVAADYIGQAEDVANLAVFLASDGAAFINGEEILVDGGRTIQL